MTQQTSARRPRLVDRWPVVVALVLVAGAVTVIALVNEHAELFGPAVATMAGIYLMAYALGRPSSAWLAFAVLSAVVTGLHLLARLGSLPVEPAVGMTLVLVPLWVWAAVRHRCAPTRTMSVQTAGMLAFGAITLLTATTQPQVGTAVAGVGFLAHGLWDAYHYRADLVVSRSWAQFCAVVDLGVGLALVVASTG
ncbi:hypothetical protein [Micromonospora tarensis]|uniref:YhhN-like protein n=1 Tax=Micromonospora tarensis TaxID=2806100 RepID=A0ABS1YNH5_9ACTN|nr:hypothetical protein [Micromonospora tarensis]MBM0278990.1 hypothetical protein [Micromonospora tarensis]